jgi:hypothetical protein
VDVVCAVRGVVQAVGVRVCGGCDVMFAAGVSERGWCLVLCWRQVWLGELFVLCQRSAWAVGVLSCRVTAVGGC